MKALDDPLHIFLERNYMRLLIAVIVRTLSGSQVIIADLRGLLSDCRPAFNHSFSFVEFMNVQMRLVFCVQTFVLPVNI